MKRIYIASILSIMSFASFAQGNIDKEVQVVRAYDPVLSDAFKINLLPSIADTVKLMPNLSYAIFSKVTNTQFKVSPMPAAKLIGEPVSAITPFFVKLGLGSTMSPLLEAYYGSVRKSDLNYGAYVRHFSSAGRIKLDNGSKRKVMQSESALGLNGKKILGNSAFEASMDYNRNRATFYGVDPTFVGSIENDSLKQVTNRFGVELGLHSLYTDSTHLNYTGRVGYTYFGDKFSMSENNLDISFSGNQFFQTERVGGEIQIMHISKSSELSKEPNTVFRLAPWIGLFGPDWRAKAGANFVSNSWGGQSDVYIYPLGEISYDVIGHYFIPYINIGGHLEVNSYEKILKENPYATPGLNVRNTNHKFSFEGGLKGKFSSSVSFNVAGSFSLSDSLYFFVNNFATNPSTFGVVYDNAQVTHFCGELVVGVSHTFSLIGRGEVTRYSLDKISKPWQKPSWEITVSSLFNLKDKIYIKASLVGVGERFAYAGDGGVPGDVTSVKLDPILDLSLGLEYRITKDFTVYTDFNNIAGGSYYQWYRYSTYGFNALAGITLSF
ncbi:TonB-dependent receptor [Williamwhitmania taraxaci]|uniref:TonB dependent receptor n=1 Tax=Williamwhitmania taraxaci TaxID=1640674 RepID=A0A1G6K543_9BACT|nr:TonB-dependent receptor [Williamwhitmania taraxaci]SDC26159.1 hypothetical protein SAMN05216323_102317 [Williamwhitmania taraxaci]